MRNFLFFIVSSALVTTQAFAGNLSNDLKNIFEDLTTIQIKEAGKAVLVFGEVNTFEQMQRVQKVVTALAEKGETVAQAITLSDAGKQALAKQMEDAIGRIGLRVRSSGDSFTLEGVAENEFEADRAVETLRTQLNYPMKADIRALSSSPQTSFGIVDMLRVSPKTARLKK